MANQEQCPECGHKSTPEKLRDQSGDTSGVDPSPDLPDEVLEGLIDDATDSIEHHLEQIGVSAEEQHPDGGDQFYVATTGVRAAAPVLVEHGVATERARIRAVLKSDETVDAIAVLGAGKTRNSRGQWVRSLGAVTVDAEGLRRQARAALVPVLAALDKEDGS